MWAANMKKEFYTVKQVCQITGLSRTMIWKLPQIDVTFPKVIKVGSRTLYSADAIHEWVDSKKAAA